MPTFLTLWLTATSVLGSVIWYSGSVKSGGRAAPIGGPLLIRAAKSIEVGAVPLVGSAATAELRIRRFRHCWKS